MVISNDERIPEQTSSLPSECSTNTVDIAENSEDVQLVKSDSDDLSKTMTLDSASNNHCSPIVSNSESLAHRSNNTSLNGISNGTKDRGTSVEKMELMMMDVIVENGKTKSKQPPIALNLGCNCRNSSSRVGYLVNIILVISNMLNYMDRYTIAGVLDEVIEYYKISKSQAGLLQSCFIIFYMLLSPVFGYLGDRFNRKYIMAGCILFWSGVTLASSFVGKDYFYLFLFLRCLVGIGEAGFSIVAPTIIADLFSKKSRSLALAFFCFAIPVGSGLGYIVGSYMAKAFENWQYALRATPALGLVCVILILLFVREPSKGAAEGETNLSVTSWLDDQIYLVKHKSFMLSSLGFTCVSFVVGAFSWWGPDFITKSILVQSENLSDDQKKLTTNVSLVFGVITCLAGLSGVALGMGAATILRRRTPSADPLICGFGMITGAPFLLIVMIICRYDTLAAWICMYIGMTLVSLNWALVTDILLYVVVPTRSSAAMAFQMFLCHALGDAGSPYLVGLISDQVSGSSSGHQPQDVADEFVSMQYALYMNCFVCVIGGGFFLGTAIHVNRDRNEANRAIKEAEGAANGFSKPKEVL